MEPWTSNLRGLVSRPDFDCSSPSWLLLRSPWAALSSVISPAASTVWPWLHGPSCILCQLRPESVFPRVVSPGEPPHHQPLHHPSSGSSSLCLCGSLLSSFWSREFQGALASLFFPVKGTDRGLTVKTRLGHVRSSMLVRCAPRRVEGDTQVRVILPER